MNIFKKSFYQLILYILAKVCVLWIINLEEENVGFYIRFSSSICQIDVLRLQHLYTEAHLRTDQEDLDRYWTQPPEVVSG